MLGKLYRNSGQRWDWKFQNGNARKTLKKSMTKGSSCMLCTWHKKIQAAVLHISLSCELHIFLIDSVGCLLNLNLARTFFCTTLRADAGATDHLFAALVCSWSHLLPRNGKDLPSRTATRFQAPFLVGFNKTTFSRIISHVSEAELLFYC